MMTKTKIKFKNMEGFNIQNGTILKRGGDMFIVAKIVIGQEQFTADPISEAIFNSPKYGYEKYKKLYVYDYALVSLSTGLSYFKETTSLDSLRLRIEEDGKFQYVNDVKIVEL